MLTFKAATDTRIEGESFIAPDEANVCESAVILANNEALKLVCGLRNGSLLCWDIEWAEGQPLALLVVLLTSDEDFNITNPKLMKMGPLPAHILQSKGQQKKALVHSMHELFQ